jgi:hypothetical protein
VDHFIARYPETAAIVLDLDHSDDPTYGQQEFACYNHHSKTYCYPPLFIFEGTSHALVTARLRLGIRPPGAEDAMILVRLLSYLRCHWPHTHILVRVDSHFATPEVIDVITSLSLDRFCLRPRRQCGFTASGRTCHVGRAPSAPAVHRPPASSRLYAEFP